MAIEAKLGYVFPGQGSQQVGMGLEFYNKYPDVAKLYDRADVLLKEWGWEESLRELCFQGPVEKLNLTEFTQPCLYVTSLASKVALEKGTFRERVIEPYMISGHSAGMLAAVTAAGVWTDVRGLNVTKRRGEEMERAGIDNPGGMAAVLGVDLETVEKTLAISITEAGREEPDVWVANENCPGQWVISGTEEGIARVSQLFDRRRFKLLDVSIAAHSPLMEKAQDSFALAITKDGPLVEPKYALVTDTGGEVADSAEAVQAALLKQLTSRVLWIKAVQEMIDNGVNAFIEVGPGEVLTKLIKRIDVENKTKVFSVHDEESLALTIAGIQT